MSLFEDLKNKYSAILKPVSQTLGNVQPQKPYGGLQGGLVGQFTKNYTPAVNSIGYKVAQAAVPVQNFIEKPPQFNFSQNIQNPVYKFGAQIGETVLNQPGRSLQAAGRIGSDIRFGKTTPQNFLGNAAEAAMLPLSFVGGIGAGGNVLKQIGAQGLKQAAKQGVISGSKLGAVFGGLQGLTDNRDSADFGQQIGKAIPSALAGGLLGGVAGGAAGALANLPLATVKAAIRKLRPNATPEQVTTLSSNYLRDKTTGRFMKSKAQWAGEVNPLSQRKLDQGKWTTRSIPKLNAEIDEYLADKIPQPGLSIKYTKKVKDAGLPNVSPKVLPKPIETLQTKTQQSQAQSGQSQITKPLEEIITKESTDVKSKVNMLDYFRTPDRVLAKIGLKKEADLIRKQYDKYIQELPVEIDKVTQWSKRVPPESNQRIFQYLDGQPVQLQPEELRVAKEIRSYLVEWADKLGLPKEKRITNYITHIFENDFIQKEFDDDLAKIIQDKVAGSVYDPFTQQRLGKLGYKEDVWQALDAYVKRATRKYNMDPALAQIKDASDKLELSQYNYVKQYIDRINLRPTEWDTLIDNAIKSTPVGYKLGARPFTSITRTARQMVYRATLGLNPGTALKNLTQGANTYARLGEKYTLVGYAKIAKAIATGSDELERVGVLKNDFIQDRALNATKKTAERIDKGLFFFFEGAERINRGAAYFGAKSKALAQGMDEQRAIEYAKKIVRDTQFTFGSIDTPAVLQSDLAKTLGQFQSFTLKQGEFLGEMVKAKDVAGFLRWSAASLAMVGSVGKLIGMEPKDLIPSVRIGVPPTLQLPFEVGSAALNAPDKFGNPRDTKRKLQDIGRAGLLYVPGSTQAKKTIGGIDAYNKGYTETSGGNVKFPVDKTPENLIRGGIFGVNTLPQAQEYYDNKEKPLGEKQSELLKLSENKDDIYNQIISGRKKADVVDLIKKNLESKETPKGEQATYVIDGEETKGYVANNKFIYLNQDGDVSTKSLDALKKAEIAEKNAIRNSQYVLDAQRALRANDFSAWVKASDAQLKSLQEFQKTLNAKTDQAKINSLQNQIEDLQDKIGKYKSYGGFKKPKKGKKISVKAIKLKIPKAKKIKVKAIKAKRVKVYKLAKVKKIKTKIPKVRLT